MGTSTQTSQQQSQSSPWAPTQPLLQNLLGAIQGQIPNYQTNPTEQSALNQLVTNAQGVPNLGPTAGNTAQSLLSGNPGGVVGNVQNNLNPIASGNLDPTKTPGIQNVLSTIQQDVGNNVNSLFAGAGRSLSGLNTQTLARGIAQGEAVPLLNQYNANVGNVLGANQGLLGSVGTGANAATAGAGLGGAVPGLSMQGPGATLGAAQMGQQFPLQNIGALENLTVPIAGLGGQMQGTSQTQMTPSFWQNLALAGQAAGGFGKLFFGGGGGA